MRQTIHTLEEQLHQQKEESKQLNARLMIESQEKVRMSERVTVLEARRQDNQAENQRLHQLLKQVQENLEHYQAATQKLREEQSLIIEKQQNEYEQRISQLLAQVHAITNESAVVQVQHNHLTKTHESLVSEHKTVITQFWELQNQYETMKIACEKLQHDHNALKKMNQAQTDELTRQQNIIIELQLNTKARDDKIAALENKSARENDKIEALRHESQFALQEKANLEGQIKQMQAMLSSGTVRAS